MIMWHLTRRQIRDGIKPVDLQPMDICTGNTGPNCDFTYTGYRVPLLVVSPYAKKHYVNHTAADTQRSCD